MYISNVGEETNGRWGVNEWCFGFYIWGVTIWLTTKWYFKIMQLWFLRICNNIPNMETPDMENEHNRYEDWKFNKEIAG